MSLWLAAAWVAVNAVVYYVAGDSVGMDGHAYWLAGRIEHPYHAGLAREDAFLYSPLFAQAMKLLAWMPWPAFLALLIGVSAVTYWWLVRPLPVRWRIPVLLLCVPEMLLGNVSPLLAAALVLSVTRPGALALPALTKVVPAGVGFGWHAVRGDWRAVLHGAAVTVALAAGSFALAPRLWGEWFRFLVDHQGDGGAGYPIRLVVAVALTVYAARTGRAWLLPVAFYLAMPLAGLVVQRLTPLVAIVRLSQRPTPQRPTSTAQRSGAAHDGQPGHADLQGSAHRELDVDVVAGREA